MTETFSGQQAENTHKAGRIAGFWIRSLAFIIDSGLLVAFGTAIGFVAMDQLAALGSSGKWLGLAIAIAYFSITDSSVGGGASPGKKLLGLKVVSKNGLPLTLARAALRSLIILIPSLLDARYPTSPAMVEAALGFLVYGGEGALITLYILNGRTRQSLHDLATGAFVIRSRTLPADEIKTEPIKKWNLLAAGAVALMVATLITIAITEEEKSGRRPLMAKVINLIETEEDVASIHALSGVVLVRRNPMGFIQITARLKERPLNRANGSDKIKGLEIRAREILKRAFNEIPEAFDVSKVGIRLSYGYDIGISVRYDTYDGEKTPDSWRKIFRE
jgi:uncharacterized RDD family membrane protein YckC